MAFRESRIRQMELYCYKAQVCSVHDGDTFHADIDLGMRVWIKNQSIRLANIDAPELTAPVFNSTTNSFDVTNHELGIMSRDALASKIMNVPVIIKTYKLDKYGRWLANVFVMQDYEHEPIICVNDWMVENGHAVTRYTEKKMK